MKINQLTNSKFLKQGDIEQPMLVTIRSIGVENVSVPGEAPKNRGVVHFDELDKGMVLNKTNLLRTAKALGSEETDDWIGKRMVLYVDENVEFGGEIVGGLRLRAARAPAQEQAGAGVRKGPSITDLEDEPPF